jgi:hypothetical protein
VPSSLIPMAGVLKPAITILTPKADLRFIMIDVMPLV